MRYHFRKLSIRTRLLIPFLAITIVSVLVFGLALLSQFRMRSLALMEDLLRADIRTALTVAAQTISVDDVVTIIEGTQADDSAYTRVTAGLRNAASLLTQSQAVLYIAAAADNPGEMWLITDTGTGSDQPVRDVVVPRIDEAAAALNGATTFTVAQIVVDEHGAWTSGFMPLRDAAGSVVAIIGADIRADWVLDMRDDVIKVALLVLAVVIPLATVAIFFVAVAITQPLKRLIAAAQAVENGEPFHPESIEFIQHYSDALGTLARVFTRMAQEVQAREAMLKQQVKTLEIQIDQSKRNQQVEEITESDFFRDLQRKKEQLRANKGVDKPESNPL